MIGVLAAPEEARWVAEFFELFKTPWEPWRPGVRYPAVLCAGAEIPDGAAPLILAFAGREIPSDRREGLAPGRAEVGALLERGGQRLPVYGSCLSFAGAAPEAASSRGGAAAVRLTRGGHTVIRAGYDLFAEVRSILTKGQPPEHAGLPTLDLHVTWVREWLLGAGVAVVEIPPVPHGTNCVACLTHDVDHPRLRCHRLDHTMLGFLHRAVFGSVARFLGGQLTVRQLARNWGAALRAPFVPLGLAADFWRQFDRYLELERGMGSTFFVIPRRGAVGRDVGLPNAGRRASRYEASDIAEDLAKVSAAGGEVGVHGIDAWLDAAAGREEARRVAATVGRDCGGVRMHWLCWRGDSPATLEAAGFSYDSTVGYGACAGYRAGTAQVYRPPGAERLLELPLIAMDTALFYPERMRLTSAQAGAVLERLLADVRRYGGVLTVNWHDRSLAPERLWETSYLDLLARLRRDGAWCPTAGAAVEWFRRRRAARIEETAARDGRLRVRVTAPEGEPPLRVRVSAAGVGVREFACRGHLEETVQCSAQT